jgi:hypothetical protein
MDRRFGHGNIRNNNEIHKIIIKHVFFPRYLPFVSFLGKIEQPTMSEEEFVPLLQ